MKNIAIIGAGGHTRSSINLLKQYYQSEILKIYDDNFNSSIDEYISDIKLIGSVSDITMDDAIFISIGDNKKREEYFDFFANRVIMDNLIHEKANIEKNVKIGKSNQILANTYINSYVEIDDNNIINTSAILEHEVKIGSHNHISVGAKICGRVTIGSKCFVGAGAIVIDKISICNDVTIGAGAVVVKNITESGTYVGNPARKIK
ncbi:NeuD/PglB/VioB family sugar acetyltransferase [Aliarcobacter cryaerophilus]|uniref:NeuD/PglB/VioB family sugar acetyltransferase n=1 Tax=Aliarcobacter cryaerophilus TaxID=28198 RepID=UPI0021B53E13|nr:NeuD/PglB/VioB family sugar acetyltransferase [Aliarcobacter cryaerophilus]MCT7487124.1 NeuD/PglB/VioB family sugar acetyltransferase [Aliarcobacter cryaerophilus]MCT7491562.1 NeuD/PglB/VioB family sugar acetyltransferase [Aliarcobacter cryaerophilus]